MIEQLIGLYENRSIAIVGSGNTALSYEGKEDCSIAMNGAILLDAPISYFVGFDRRLPSREFWLVKPEIPRIVGANLIGLYPDAYERPYHVETRQTMLEDAWLAENPPKPPHCYFFYEKVELPTIGNGSHLHHRGNVAHVGFELAVLMGASTINIYGVGMGNRIYYDGKNEGGRYGQHVSDYLNGLILMANERGITVNVKREVDSLITAGETF